MAAATTSCTRLPIGLGELPDAARRGVDLGAAQHVSELARRRGDGGQRSAGFVEDLAEQVVRMQRVDLDDQLVAQDQAEDGVVAEAGLVDPIEAHGGDNLARGGDVLIDGVEQRPPAGDGGGRDEGGAIQQDGSHGI